MNPLFVIFAVLGAILAFISHSLQPKPFFPVDEGVCHVQEGEFSSNPECYFSSGYYVASARFLASAKKAGAEIIEMDVTEGLTTQVAVLHGDPERFLVHISGTHGPETYAGSAIQLAALDTNFYAHKPTIVFIHSLNPHGFLHGRRVNEDNVDLNRNMLTDDQFAFVQSRHPNYANYENFDSFINPTTKPTGVVWVDEILSVFHILSVFLRHDFGAIKKAMVSGNYHKQTGYGFGGFQRTASVNNLLSLLTERLDLPHKAKELILLDVHTGLGPQGVDTLIFRHEGSDLEEVFPMEMDASGRPVGALKANSASAMTNKDAAAVAAGYELTMGMTENLCENFLAPNLSDDKRLCIGQEFGTVPTMVVGRSVLDENYAHFHGSQQEKLAYQGERYLGCFYVRSKTWKRSVVKRGLTAIQQAIRHLSREL